MKKTPKEIAIMIGIVLLVIGIGLFAMNQFLLYSYKVQILMDPCNLCLSLNEHLEIKQRININFKEINLSNITYDSYTSYRYQDTPSSFVEGNKTIKH